ncbi:MAG: NAD(P)/FAD-dependent oxidoreductase [Planctomycetota bacterium]
MEEFDVVIVGAGFAGLACAQAAAKGGLKVVVLERKKDVGDQLHTTGILVKEAADAFEVPEELVHEVTRVRLYSPDLSHIDLNSPDYFFHATNTPGVMRHLCKMAEEAGAEIRTGTSYFGASKIGNHFDLSRYPIRTKALVGADGPRSRVALDFGLGTNSAFLLGAELEFDRLDLDPSSFHCFLDNQLAHGYLAWVIPGVNMSQVGLATRLPKTPDLNLFMEKTSHLFDYGSAKLIGRRGGLIPVGGTVAPHQNEGVFLLGDASGVVSPLTGGGIHTALHCGKELGEKLADWLGDENPTSKSIPKMRYRGFRVKHVMRWCFEHLATNRVMNLVIKSFWFKWLAREVFFRPKRL